MNQSEPFPIRAGRRSPLEDMRCDQCGYPLDRSRSRHCPECGPAAPAGELFPLRLRRRDALARSVQVLAIAAIHPARLVGMIDARHSLVPFLALAAINAMMVFVVGALLQGGFLGCVALLIMGPVGVFWVAVIGVAKAVSTASLAVLPFGLWIVILLLLAERGGRDVGSLRRLTAASACVTGVQVLCSPLLFPGAAVAAVWSVLLVVVCIRALNLSSWLVGACVVMVGGGTAALWRVVT